LIDIHTHILPGIDDGADCWDQSLEMLGVAIKNGITAIAATPHMFPDGPFVNKKERVLSLTKELTEKARSKGMSIEIYPGGEVYVTPDIRRRLVNEEILTYNDAKKYLLLEMARDEIPVFMGQVIFELKLIGITPIIAHPERNLGVIQHPEKLYSMVAQGALVQLSASSLGTTSSVLSTAKLLLKSNLVHFVASDAHNADRRGPWLNKCINALRDLVGQQRADQVLVDNPRAVLSGEVLGPQPEPLSTITVSKKGRRFFGFLRRR
jgi:protein-tyrosine phosphatase